MRDVETVSMIWDSRMNNTIMLDYMKNHGMSDFAG